VSQVCNVIRRGGSKLLNLSLKDRGMAKPNFIFTVADPKTAKTYQKEAEKKRCAALIGLKIGDEFDGGIIGLPGYRLVITGGADESGFPMKAGVAGQGRKSVLLAGPPGYRPERKGVRKRKTVRGSVVSEDLIQINTKVLREGKQSLDELFGKAPAAKEEPKQEKAAAATA